MVERFKNYSVSKTYLKRKKKKFSLISQNDRGFFYVMVVYAWYFLVLDLVTFPMILRDMLIIKLFCLTQFYLFNSWTFSTKLLNWLYMFSILKRSWYGFFFFFLFAGGGGNSNLSDSHLIDSFLNKRSTRIFWNDSNSFFLNFLLVLKLN